MALVAAAAATMVACGDDDGEALGRAGQEIRHDMCGVSTAERDVRDLLNGNLVVVGTYAAQGRTGADMALGLGLLMAFNGIDFTDLNPKYEFHAENGTYSYKNGEAGWSVSLYWAKDTGAFKAGDKLVLDALSVDSFVQNVRVIPPSWDDPLGVKVRWDPGPLAALIDGDIEFDTNDPLKPGVKLRLRTDHIALELASVGIHRGIGFNYEDTFVWRIATLRSTLSDIIQQAKTGAGYGLTFEESRYRSPYYGVDEDFGFSRLMILSDAENRVHIEGTYDAALRVTRPGQERAMWQRGFVSSRFENRTEYFCDEARTRRLGVATHALTLDRGTFVLDATGAKVDYGLERF